MRGHGIVLMVAAVTALVMTAAPGAGATSGGLSGTRVLQGLSAAVDINNHDVVAGLSGSTPVRWESPGWITVLPVPAGTSWTRVREITDSGFVVGEGSRYDEGGYLNGVLLWGPDGRLIDAEFPAGSRETHANDVNESGTVVGCAYEDGAQHAARWDAQGRVTELRALRGGTFSTALAINNQGETVGYSDVVIAGTHVTHAVYWDAAGRVADLGNPLSGAFSEAVDINNAHVIVGHLGNQTVKWSRLRRVTVLQPPPGFASYGPAEVNDAGVVLGYGYPTQTTAQHPIRWDAQGWGTDLGGGYLYRTWGSAMNSAGTVVGASDDGYHMVEPPRESYAVQWDPAGRMSYLIGVAGAWNSAMGVNDDGVVCGVSGDNDGTNRHGVLWNWR
jgi:YD repeat-containing protein